MCHKHESFVIENQYRFPVLTMATPGHYTECALRLKKDCADLGITCDGFRLPDGLERDEACKLKPRYILRALDLYPSGFWWIDADDRLLKMPSPFGPIPGFGWIRNPEERVIKTTLWISSSCTFWSRSNFSLAFVDRWARLTPGFPNDHRALMATWYAMIYPTTPPEDCMELTWSMLGCYQMTGHVNRETVIL